MNIEINCCLGKRLLFDIKETKELSNNTGIEIPVYRCEGCNKLYTLTLIGEKNKGWEVKDRLSEREIIDSIPF